MRAEVHEVCDGLAGTLEELCDLSWACSGHLRRGRTSGRPSALVRSSPLLVRVQMRADGRLPATAKQPRITLAAGAFHQREHADDSAVGILIERADGVRTVRVRDDSVGGADAIAARIWSACRTRWRP